ncbi:hypothetical protein MPTK1_2g22550 [Marchantia polymorpha subsp. ruderalis]|uniref:Uncharacterized protein n=1 Tax=Marchantia polymorpha TaxID=3197 RepID=A0A2R6WN98_MARPO|nr:hypothetical protein MARPO_0072s0076 [Marchantia polymorpha]BBN03317.1 hypothetical protein Mp_2g22550 [Marchantia polymorpha subsp. ruderalis]|eukprot:PTQ35334.1 hypothetical protein MARPO_0072s0076 [Marchantia polymorpha]
MFRPGKGHASEGHLPFVWTTALTGHDSRKLTSVPNECDPPGIRIDLQTLPSLGEQSPWPPDPKQFLLRRGLRSFSSYLTASNLAESLQSLTDRLP